MSKKSEFDNILNECLERLISGESIETCLADYPAYADELEPLLRTVVDARKVASVEPHQEFRERSGYDFQAAIREMEPERAWGFFAWFPRWAAITTVVVVVILLAATGTAVASINSLPDEPLYQVKLATEAVRLAFTPSSLGKAELYASFADERVEEIVRMADKGDVAQVEKATERMNDQLIAMSNLVVPGRGEDTQMDMTAFEAAPAPVPAPTPAPAPEPEPEPEEPQLQVKEPPTEALPDKAQPAPVIEIPPEAVVEAPAPTAPGAAVMREEAGADKERDREDEEVETDDEARLRTIVSEQALKNSKKLQELLENAPEALKPALRRALEVADNGYGQALRNLK